MPTYASKVPLSLGEQVALRSYTGQAIGSALTDILKFKRVGILTNQTSICAGLTGAIGAQIVAKSQDTKDPLKVVDLANAEGAARGYEAVKQMEAIALIFGGQASAEENYALTKASLKELAANAYPGAVFLHVRVWMPKMAQRAAAEDAQIAQYLANKDNLYTITIDAPNGKALVHQVSINANEQRSVKVLHEVTMSDSWLELLKRSI
ncbi:MAG TPA: hypothetical protein IGR15_12835 [Synechococcus sp. M44_DOE_062]|nr:hypothetical protein [Synechococcus sp. M44_DOE_062]